MLLMSILLLLSLIVGVLLVALSLPMFGISGLLLLVSTFMPPLVPLATGILAVASGAFVLGMILTIVGLSSLLSTQVVTWIASVWQLLIKLLSLVPSFETIGPFLRNGAETLEALEQFFTDQTEPALAAVTGALGDAASTVPDIPVITFNSTSLWSLLQELGIPLPSPAPDIASDVKVVTSISTTESAALHDVIETTRENVEVGIQDGLGNFKETISSTAQMLRGIADILDSTQQSP